MTRKPPCTTFAALFAVIVSIVKLSNCVNEFSSLLEDMEKKNPPTSEKV